jgi:predicted nucleic acid-binding protein
MSSKSIRAVFDTDILVSVFNWRGGNPEKIYQAARAEQFTLLSSPAVIAEMARILRNKLFWNEETGFKSSMPSLRS